ncbi:MAG: rRNA cytosine-C5-methyltransferase [Prevotellaceae bacterium]|nr:rRNA cytosine-C5-methyltransferase [Prevotellaceae bacterium]
MNLPAAFLSSIERLLGPVEAGRLAEALAGTPSTAIRLNARKLTVDAPYERVPWCASGRYLPRRIPFTFDPLFHAGAYYVQEAASMFVEQAVGRYAGEEAVAALDLCAAPGGKSTLLSGCLPRGSLLVANEVIRGRAQVLVENMVKWGDPSVVVTNNDPTDFARLGGFFDVLLADVPCSGEGMFRKEAAAMDEWSPEAVELCRARQRRILADSWDCLRQGGLLIYSTCTFNTEENEGNVRWLCDTLGAEALPLEVPADWHVTGNLLPGESFPVYRFLPHRTKGEGFFMAVLRKAEASPGAMAAEAGGGIRMEKRGGKRGGKDGLSTATRAGGGDAVRSWLRSPDEFVWLQEGGRISAFPQRHSARLQALHASLRILKAGVTVAEAKGRDWLPHHALAMSTALNPEAFPHVPLDYQQAIAYLRKEAPAPAADAPRGIVIVTYKGIPLGFAKNLGNRANNLYPMEWRIRSGYLPSSSPCNFL